MPRPIRLGGPVVPALVLGVAAMLAGGCGGEETVPIVPDSTPAAAPAGDAPPAAGAEVNDAIRDSMMSADPSLPPGRKE